MTASPLQADLPRERMLHVGVAALSTRELLTLLISSGTAKSSAAQIAHDILERFTSLADLSSRDVVELMSIHGMGLAKATTLCAAFELARRIQSEPFSERITVSTPAMLAQFLIPRMRHLRTESFRVVLLNSANQVIREICVSDGSLNAVLIHPREVFRLAIAENAASIIVAHNHPSGNVEPSPEDVAITKQLVEAGRIVDIRVLDHLIIAGDTYTSFVERGLM